jgi:hypothetical protein
MPAAYVDTSALVKRYVAEVGSAWVRRVLAPAAGQVIYTSVLAQPEVVSALQRKVREEALEAERAHRLTQRVTTHCAQRYRLIMILPSIVTQACALLAAHPLRAYDALHLACALAARARFHQEGLPVPHFVAADSTLLAAAQAEGFPIENPLWHP